MSLRGMSTAIFFAAFDLTEAGLPTRIPEPTDAIINKVASFNKMARNLLAAHGTQMPVTNDWEADYTWVLNHLYVPSIHVVRRAR